MSKSQCLDYALTKWNEEGGYLVLCKSSHWCMPHVLHMDNDKRFMTHYVPNSELNLPWHSMLGFDGSIITNDTLERKPINAICILMGSVVLLILGSIWAIKRKFKQYRKLVQKDKNVHL